MTFHARKIAEQIEARAKKAIERWFVAVAPKHSDKAPELSQMDRWQLEREFISMYHSGAADEKERAKKLVDALEDIALESHPDHRSRDTMFHNKLAREALAEYEKRDK